MLVFRKTPHPFYTAELVKMAWIEAKKISEQYATYPKSLTKQKEKRNSKGNYKRNKQNYDLKRKKANKVNTDCNVVILRSKSQDSNAGLVHWVVLLVNTYGAPFVKKLFTTNL